MCIALDSHNYTVSGQLCSTIIMAQIPAALMQLFSINGLIMIPIQRMADVCLLECFFFRRKRAESYPDDLRSENETNMSSAASNLHIATQNVSPLRSTSSYSVTSAKFMLWVFEANIARSASSRA